MDTPQHSLLTGLFTVAAPGAAPAALLAQAAVHARQAGLAVLELGMQPAAEARELVDVLAAIALQGVRMGRAAVPTVILSAGPVLLREAPAGAAQFLLALALALDEHPAIHACAVDAAPEAHGPGFFLRPTTVLRARSAGLDPGRALGDGTAGAVFAQLGDCLALPVLGREGQDAHTVLRAVLLS